MHLKNLQTSQIFYHSCTLNPPLLSNLGSSDTQSTIFSWILWHSGNVRIGYLELQLEVPRKLWHISLSGLQIHPKRMPFFIFPVTCPLLQQQFYRSTYQTSPRHSAPPDPNPALPFESEGRTARLAITDQRTRGVTTLSTPFGGP